MDVLRARAEMKNSRRLPATLIRRSENNPLKFAATAEEAVARLLGPPDPAYLGGTTAIDDAMHDRRIRACLRRPTAARARRRIATAPGADMTPYNKVIWSEGLFLRPQHMQQERYFERFVELRAGALRLHAWGFAELELEQ